MPTQIEKIEAHAGHLLDAFLALRERYAMLDPLLFDQVVCAARCSGRQWRGLVALRTTLFLSCAQDIAKLATDSDERAPSLCNIAFALRDEELAAALKARYAAWVVPSIENETDPEIAEALRLLEIDERAGRADEFDRHLRDLLALVSGLADSPEVKAFRTIRDKVTAHTEIRFVADKYQLLDISALGLKWREIAPTIASLQQAVALVGMVVRNAGFAWESLDKQLSEMAGEFWTPTAAEPLGAPS